MCGRGEGERGSHRELLILHELWAGEQSVLEKAVPSWVRAGRPISVSAVPVGPGMDLLFVAVLRGLVALCWKALYLSGTVGIVSLLVILPWRLLAGGHVHSHLTAGGPEVGLVEVVPAVGIALDLGWPLLSP